MTSAHLMKRSRKTRKEQFLEEMDAIIPWQRLLSAIEPFYPMATRGRCRIPLEAMLHIHLLQHFPQATQSAGERSGEGADLVHAVQETGRRRTAGMEAGNRPLLVQPAGHW